MAHYYPTGSVPGGSVVMSEPVVHVGGYSDPYYSSPVLGAATGTSATYVEPYHDGRYAADPVVGGTYYSGVGAPHSTYLPHQIDGSVSAYPASVSERSYGHYPHELNRRVLPTTRKRTVRVTEYLVDDMGHQELVSQNVNPDAPWEGSGGIPRDARMVGEDLYLVEAKGSKHLKHSKRGPSSPRSPRSPRPRARSPRPTPRSGSAAPSSPRFHSTSRLSPSPYHKPTKAKKKKPASRAWH